METLEAAVADHESVSLDLSEENYPILVVKNTACEAKVALHGAHLFHWQPAGHDPVIYTSPTAVYREGKAIRGGVPICWPWFNAHPTDPAMPSHGIGRNRFWKLESIESESDAVSILTFSLTASAETKAIWPYDFKAKVIISLGKEVSVTLQTTNSGEQEMTVGGALHTYLHVSDISDAVITGLEGGGYLDTVGQHAERVQDGAITFAGEVDRIYHNTASEITLKDATRKLAVSREGSNTAVIWNPWIEKAKGLGDLPDEGYQDFVCIEAANALSDVYVLQPGESHALATSIRVA